MVRHVGGECAYFCPTKSRLPTRSAKGEAAGTPATRDAFEQGETTRANSRMSWNWPKSIAGILFPLLFLCGCGSSPSTHFFTLDATVPDGDQAHVAVPHIQVSAVHLPPDLDRTEIVREGRSGELTVSNQNRWGAPLDELMRRTLTEDLAKRLPDGAVIPPMAPRPPGTCDIVIDTLQFGGKQSDDVAFEGSWTLLDPETGKSLYTHQVQIRDQAPAQDYAAQAAAMSRTLGRFADQIASALPSEPDACR